MQQDVPPTPPQTSPLVSLSRARAKAGRLSPLLQHAARPLEKALGIDLVNETYDHLRGHPTPESFIAALLDYLKISFSVPAADLERIPATGPLIVVANHPFGAIEGIVLASLLMKRRPDVKILANHLLGEIPEIRDLFFLVNVLSGNAAADNIRSMRQVFRHLRDGGVLGMFPAGEVAHLGWSGRITESPWSPHLARMIRVGKCPVLPINFAGNNSLLFHMAGFAHPRLRTALLARELFKLRNSRIDVRVGAPIPAIRLGRMDDDAKLISYVRSRTLALGQRPTHGDRTRPAHRIQAPVVSAIPENMIEAEVNHLGADHILAENGDMCVCLATASQIPQSLREIGRLREVTFRETGEGTGREVDLDRYDDYYKHLFIYHRAQRQIVGAYRVGYSEPILRQFGLKGFYTHTLFKFKPALFDLIGPFVELGRSFVRPEFQKSYAPLLLLWKGIGQVAVRDPQYCRLLGPVSISAEYHSVSRQMMVDFLNCHFTDPQLIGAIKPRRSFRASLELPFMKPGKGEIPADAEQLSDLISDIEQDGKGIPILLKQYLRLGARVLCFNVDPDFADVLDVLALVDLRHTERPILDRYMGSESAASFLQHHGISTPTKP